MKYILFFVTMMVLGYSKSIQGQTRTIKKPVSFSIYDEVVVLKSFIGYNQKEPFVIGAAFETEEDSKKYAHYSDPKYVLASYLSATNQDWLSSLFCDTCDVPQIDFEYTKKRGNRKLEKMELIQRMRFVYEQKEYETVKLNHLGHHGIKFATRAVLFEKINNNWVVIDQIPEGIKDIAEWSVRIKPEYGNYFTSFGAALDNKEKIPVEYFEFIHKCSAGGAFDFGCFSTMISRWEKSGYEKKIAGLFDDIPHWGLTK